MAFTNQNITKKSTPLISAFNFSDTTIQIWDTYSLSHGDSFPNYNKMVDSTISQFSFFLFNRDCDLIFQSSDTNTYLFKNGTINDSFKPNWTYFWLVCDTLVSEPLNRPSNRFGTAVILE